MYATLIMMHAKLVREIGARFGQIGTTHMYKT